MGAGSKTGGIDMKKNPGRRERRNLMFANRRAAGKKRAKINEFHMKVADRKKAETD